MFGSFQILHILKPPAEQVVDAGMAAVLHTLWRWSYIKAPWPSKSHHIHQANSNACSVQLCVFPKSGQIWLLWKVRLELKMGS